MEREFLHVALWPRKLGPGCGVFVADPRALLRLSLPYAGWRPAPRAWRSAVSSLARVPFSLARRASAAVYSHFGWPDVLRAILSRASGGACSSAWHWDHSRSFPASRLPSFCYVPFSKAKNANMTDFDFKRDSEPVSERWQGLAELDRALAENRLTEYRWKKAWADPISRTAMIAVFVLLGAFVGYVVISDLFIGH